MKSRAVFSGVIGSIFVLVPLWLIIYYIWPSRILNELEPPVWIEIFGYITALFFILATGYISAKWNWAKTRTDAILSGGVSGLLNGSIAYTLIGAAGMGLMGNREILRSLNKLISSENEGISFFYQAVVSTAYWVYLGFWLSILIGVVFGTIGGLLALRSNSMGLGKKPDDKEKWLYRLPVYTLTFSGFISYIISMAVFLKLFDTIREGIGSTEFLSPILTSSSDIAIGIISFTILILLYIPLAITIGWILRGWTHTKKHFLSYLWLFLCAIIVICNLNSPQSSLGLYLIVLFIFGSVIFIAYKFPKRHSSSISFKKYSPYDWLTYALVQGVLGGAQTFVGVIPYSLAMTLLAITNVSHLFPNDSSKNEIVQESARSQVDLFLPLMTGSGLLFIIVMGCVGLLVGVIVFLSRKAFFYEDYFQEDVLEKKDILTKRNEDLSIPNKATVFISYSHADSSFVERLIGDLKKGNIDVWIDKWMIRVGDSITGKINEGIKSSDFLIIVLSPESVKSRWVQEELNTALIRNIERRRGAYILPILIAECDIPLLLTHRRYANFTEEYTKGYLELIEAIQYQTR